jgi:hypothetical protein
LEDFLILKNTRHDRDVEGYLSRMWMDWFRRVVFEPGDRANFIFGSVKVIIRVRQFLREHCVRSIDGRKIWLNVIRS